MKKTIKTLFITMAILSVLCIGPVETQAGMSFSWIFNWFKPTIYTGPATSNGVSLNGVLSKGFDSSGLHLNGIILAGE